jgi:NAD(P)-dependent dehydrogenase (short-subunit alcohol dehydrogenase family)
MNGFADTLAQELLGKGILVTTICPGGIDTPLWDLEKNPYPSDKTRIMQTEEIVDLIEYLLDQPAGALHKKNRYVSDKRMALKRLPQPWLLSRDFIIRYNSRLIHASVAA